MNEIIKGDKKSELGMVGTKTTVAYSAPLPEASQFEYYNKVVPGAADRILKMAENQSAHRQGIEKWAIVGDQIRSFFGLLCGFLVAVLGLGGAIFLIYKDKTMGGLLLGGGVLVSLVGSFIIGSNQKEKDLEESKK